jgi:hypothetical protein
MYVIVVYPGTDDEHILPGGTFKTKAESLKALDYLVEFHNESYDLMKRLPDGSLTTEF